MQTRTLKKLSLSVAFLLSLGVAVWYGHPDAGISISRAAAAEAVADSDTPNGPYPGYMSWPAVKSKIADWTAAYPKLVTVSSLGKTYEGRDIPVVRICSKPDGAGTPEVMILSGIHPREQQPVIAVTRLVDKLLAGYSKDASLTKLVDERAIYIVPIFNVDGKVYDLKNGNGTSRGADWRKNREPNADGTVGTDLNRNFGVRWGGARGYDPEWKASTIDTGSNIYEGDGPMSEPETRHLGAFIAAHKANLRAFMDLHSPLHVINLPAYAIGPDYDRYMALVAKMREGQAEPYPASDMRRDAQPPDAPRAGNSGVTYTWAYYTQGVYALNLEFAPPAKHKAGILARYAPPDEIQSEYTSNIEGALLNFIDLGGTFPAAHSGSASCKVEDALISGDLIPGATVSWSPKSISGPCDYAVLVSGSRSIVVPSEYRLAPIKSGFTLQVDPKAVPGTSVPMTLYLWDRNRGETVAKFNLTIAPTK